MLSLLKQLGLVKECELKFEVSREAFVTLLKQHLDRDRFNPFEVFSSSKHRYKGSLKENEFTIKRTRRLFDSKTSWIRARGSFNETDGNLIINLMVTGWNHYMTVAYAFIGLYGFFVGSALLYLFNSYPLANWLLFLLLALTHLALMLVAPILFLRQAVNSLELLLSKDLANLVRHGKF